MGNSIVRTVSLTKDYGSASKPLHVLRGIDVEIARGEIVAIVGPSGVGKSTLLHLLGALDKPTSGEVHIDDRSIHTLSENEMAEFRNRRVGFVFQFHYLLPEFSALENVMMPAFISGRGRDEVSTKAHDLLGSVGLLDRTEHRPNALSGGEQQRVAFARALINSPSIVLADEPTGNLDREASQRLHELILTMCRENQQTFVIVTHNEDLASQADRVIELRDGKVASDAYQQTTA